MLAGLGGEVKKMNFQWTIEHAIVGTNLVQCI